MSDMSTSTPMSAPAPAVDPATMQKMEARYRLVKTMTGGADWFFWIAALSAINSIVYLTGGSTFFVAGLGTTQLIDAFASVMMEGEISSMVSFFTVLNIILDLAVIVLFVVFGIFARKAHRWAFIVGMVLYVLDTLILVWAVDWFSILFHAWALFGLFTGYRAISAIKKLDYQDAVISPA